MIAKLAGVRLPQSLLDFSNQAQSLELAEIRKLAIVRAAAEHAFPTADIDQMLAEIERRA